MAKLPSLILSLIVAVSLLSGCGRGVSTAVTGKVLLDNQPLPGASVQLLRTDTNSEGGMHSATTDAEGRFRFAESGGSNNPIQPGSYVVLVSKSEMPANAANLPGGGMGADRELVPVVYQDRTNSPIQAQITGPNTELPTFELKSTAK